VSQELQEIFVRADVLFNSCPDCKMSIHREELVTLTHEVRVFARSLVDEPCSFMGGLLCVRCAGTRRTLLGRCLMRWSCTLCELVDATRIPVRDRRKTRSTSHWRTSWASGRSLWRPTCAITSANSGSLSVSQGVTTSIPKVRDARTSVCVVCPVPWLSAWCCGGRHATAHQGLGGLSHGFEQFSSGCQLARSLHHHGVDFDILLAARATRVQDFASGAERE
jgi:hypothetical protein